MSKELENLHILTAEAVISQQKYMAGIITLDEFSKEIKELDCHCHNDIVIDEKHKELDCCYREQLNGILKMCNLEDKK
ncbi:MAG: hypothetical protein FJY17_00565 [Bacteroidetes bacterium]|nr:hypothetical protein [Bacteroidota bacterium]